MNTRIAQSAGRISLATAASRILGFVRDLLIAKLFGTGIQAEAFVVAFRLPNLFRDLVAEGAVTTAIVPVLSSYRATKSAEAFWRLAQATGVKVLLAGTLIGVCGLVAAPWLVGLVAPGFRQDQEKFALAVTLTRWLFPFITLASVWAFFSGLLNSLHDFTVSALGPAALNLLMILGCLWIVPRVVPGVLGLVWAVLLGGVIQLAMQLPAVRARGFRWRWIWRHEGSGQMLRLLGPRLIGNAVYQVSVLFDTAVASLGWLVGGGAVASLYFANRLVQLPLALFATASSQASLPLLAERAAVNDFATFRTTVLSVLRVVAFESVPAAVGLFVLAEPIVRICFERGAFSHGATLMTAHTLRLCAVGLLGYAASKVLTGAFYALHDTRTPVRLAVQALILNMALALILVRPLQVGGLALATAISSSVNAWRLLAALERRIGSTLRADLLGAMGRIVPAALVMGLACWALAALLIRPQHQAASLLVVIVGGIIVYGSSCALLRVPELATGLRWLTRMTQPSSSA